MAVNCGLSFGVCRTRVTRVDGEGNVIAGAGNSYVSDRMISVGVNPNVEAGQDFSRRNGCGCSMSRRRGKRIFNWWEFAFANGALEPAMEALMTGGAQITNGADVVGVAFPSPAGCTDDEWAVAFEFWTEHDVEGHQDLDYPWVHWVYPYVTWERGEATVQEEYLSNAYVGFSRSNPQWGEGPYGDGPPDGEDISEGGYWKTASDPPNASCTTASVSAGS